MSPDHASPADPATTTGPWRRTRWIGAVIAAGLVAGGVTGWHWHTHPDVFPLDGNGVGTTLRPGQSIYIGETYPGVGEGPTVTIDRVSPRIVSDTAGATIEYVVCTVALDGDAFTAFGSVEGHLFAEMCPDPVPVEEGTTLDLSADSHQQLVSRVTVTKPGVLLTEGIDLTYRHGWQSGTQATSMHLEITAK